VGPRAVLHAAVKRKIPSPRRKSNPRTPIVQPIALFENIVLRKILRPKMDEVREQFKILHNDKLDDLFRSLIIVRLVK
jgi:hypothetical protein